MSWQMLGAVLLTSLLFGLLLCVAAYCGELARFVRVLYASFARGCLSTTMLSGLGYGLYRAAARIAYWLGDLWSLPPHQLDALVNWILAMLILALLVVGLAHRRRLRSWAERLHPRRDAPRVNLKA